MADSKIDGMFYLGWEVDPTTGKVQQTQLLYPSKQLTTHAVCVGMTGSGKTGLGIALLEEAALEKIPSIIIDPKGDLANLQLTFPHLVAEEFAPWVDKTEAERLGLTTDEYAAETADKWKKGLEAAGLSGHTIETLRATVDIVIYTPASRAGIPLSILGSFAAPSSELLLDSASLRERILTTTSSLLGLLGIAADPIKSREHILIASIIDHAWHQGRNLDLTALVTAVQNPPFSKVGALDLDTFYPPKERMELSVRLNNLLAAPGFQAWMEGDPLDIDRLLYSSSGKPQLSIISIAHLPDSERMFFVTLLLNELICWMRRQPGSASLRAVLYMDEIFGFFPPTAMPPSKLPMLTLLKQARAYGLGLLLVTQNPVDLDYKGLSNCGTWLIGKLQTERDRARVLEGLQMASNGELDSKTLDKMIALTGNRIFILRTIYNVEPKLFQTRWALSFLRGPLTPVQIASLTERREAETAVPAPAKSYTAVSDSSSRGAKGAIPPSIAERFARLPTTPQPAHYEPRLVGSGKLHFVDSKWNVDLWREVWLITAPNGFSGEPIWNAAIRIPDLPERLELTAIPNSSFGALPSAFQQEKNFAAFGKSLAVELYQNETYSLLTCPELAIAAKEDESEGQFRQRANDQLAAKREAAVKKIREKFASKIELLEERVKRAEEKKSAKTQKVWMQRLLALMSLITTFMGALFSRKVTQSTISQAGTSMRRAGQMNKESQDAAQAQDDCERYSQQLEEAKVALQLEVDQLESSMAVAAIEPLILRPRKSDIATGPLLVVWWPVP
jgi:hypothetical protein